MEAILPADTKEAYAVTLPSDQHRARFYRAADALEGLIRSDKPVTQCMEEFVSAVADLFAATAVAVWFPCAEDSALQRKVEAGWNHFALDDSSTSRHEALLLYALRRQSPVVVPPFSAPSSGAGVSNPTDAYLLLAPVAFDAQNIAVLEIVLGPKPLRRPHRQLVEAYVGWLKWLVRILGDQLQRGLDQAEQPLHRAIGTLDETERTIETLQDQIRQQLEKSIQALAGTNFGSLAANQEVAKRVHTLLDNKGLRVRCPECGTPAILRCQKAGNSRTGAFMFDHYLDTGRTFHGGQTTFPLVTVTNKPPRRKTGGKEVASSE